MRVAFEIDHVDYTYHRGWSVMVRGTTAVVDDPAEVARIRAVWEPKPWASGDRSLLLKLPVDRAHGTPARFRLGPDVRASCPPDPPDPAARR